MPDFTCSNPLQRRVMLFMWTFWTAIRCQTRQRRKFLSTILARVLRLFSAFIKLMLFTFRVSWTGICSQTWNAWETLSAPFTVEFFSHKTSFHSLFSLRRLYYFTIPGMAAIPSLSHHRLLSNCFSYFGDIRYFSARLIIYCDPGSFLTSAIDILISFYNLMYLAF